MYLLEYYTGEKKEQKGMFHLDMFKEEESKTRYNHLPFTFGWSPVCLVPDDLSSNAEFSKLLDLMERKPYEDVVRVITLFVADCLIRNYKL